MLELPTGEKLCQTKAILRMLGSMHGYYEIQEPRQAWQIDSIVESVDDALKNFGAVLMEEDHQQMLALKAKYLTVDFPKWLFVLERRLERQQKLGAKWISSRDAPSIADFSLGGLLCSVHANEENSNYFTYNLIISRHPNVSHYIDHFKSEMAVYLSQRI